MIVPRRKDVRHKNIMLRLLREIISNNLLTNSLVFKGGTYAALLGILNRFSVDLDFDLPDINIKNDVRDECYKIFDKLDLSIKDESKNHLQFFLKYDAPHDERNTLKLEINDVPSKFNEYEAVSLREINMYCNGHTLPTMFANKMVASMARYEKTGEIAGRDFYDMHVFFEKGLNVNTKVVEDLTKMSYKDYLRELLRFIDKHVSNKLLQEDLNVLLGLDEMQKVVPVLRAELLGFVRDEIERG